MNGIDMSLVDWSRAQFALTAIYHWFFVPLTLGLSFIVAIIHTIYVKSGNEEWKPILKFWMKIFGINFAIGVSTGIILEFEFGTNWSNYSWFVGDIFGAPLAVEGIMAFFLESTFIAIMFFGWDKVSKKFHMLSSWLVAFGSNLSALWILVANAWMQYPVGMKFNPDTMRNEMDNFWEVLLSPMAVHKFLHTISSGYIIGSLVVVGVGAWYLLRGRHILFAKRSIVIGATFGLMGSLLTAFSGDSSAYTVAQHQPMKFAAFEGLYDGAEGAGLVPLGVLNRDKVPLDEQTDYHFHIEIPKLLSGLAMRDFNAFVPGIHDLLEGNEKYGILPMEERMSRGKMAIQALNAYKQAKKDGKDAEADAMRQAFEQNYEHMGYGYLPDAQSAVPDVPGTFYSFHTMVALGLWFILLFGLMLWFAIKNKISDKKFILKAAIWSIPLGYLASQLGWIVAELGRQPWTIQDILPTMVSTSHLSTSSVKLTFFLFLILFTALLIAELKIMFRAIKKGPEGV